MAKWDLTDLEREISDLQDLVAKVREVNEAQAEQLRKAQEKIRATALRELQAWGQAQDAWEAQKDAEEIASRALDDAAETHAIRMQAARDRAWNEAIEAAAALMEELEFRVEAKVVRSLAKEAGG